MISKANKRAAAVEFSLLSTTTKKETAIQYSGASKQRGSVLQIDVSRVDVGASIKVSALP